MFTICILTIKGLSSLVAVHGAAAVLPLGEAVVPQEPGPLLPGPPGGCQGDGPRMSTLSILDLTIRSKLGGHFQYDALIQENETVFIYFNYVKIEIEDNNVLNNNSEKLFLSEHY